MECKEMTSEGSVLGPGKMSWTPGGSLGSNALSSWKPLLSENYGSPPLHRNKTAYLTSLYLATSSHPCPHTHISGPWVLSTFPASWGCAPVSTLTFPAARCGHTT